nr:modification methylase ngomiv [Quercus suber]
MTRCRRRVPPTIDLTEDNDPAHQRFDFHIVEEDDSTLNDIVLSDDDPDHEVSVGLTVPPGYHEVHSAWTDSEIFLEPGSNVELDDGYFLRIKHIFRSRHSGETETILRGVLMCRFKDHRIEHLKNLFPKLKNELVIMQSGVHPRCSEVRLDDHLVDRYANEVVSLREIIFTNRVFGGTLSMERFPDLSFRDETDLRRMGYMDGNHVLNEQYIDDHAVLVARYVSIQFAGKQGEKAWSGALMRLIEHQSDPGKGIPDAALVYWWCHTEMHGHAPCAFPPGYKHDLTGEKRSNSKSTTTKPKETVLRRHFDICAGAGGAATGVQMAKSETHTFNVAFLLDDWESACRTLRRAFPDAEVLMKDIHDFCTEHDGRDYRVTTVHISFPCQVYSPAHTVAGKNDDRNQATGYSTEPILRKTRARHVTMEQTKGIVSLKTKNKGAFAKMVNQLTSMQYSVRWKVVSSANHAGVQGRERLIICASA